MKRLLLLLALLLPVPAEAAFAFVQSRTACASGCNVTDDFSDNNIVVTGLTGFTVGNTVVVWAMDGSATRLISSVTDAGGNTYTVLHFSQNSTGFHGLRAGNVAVTSTTLTVTLNGTSPTGSSLVVVAEFSGGAATLTESGTSSGAANFNQTSHPTSTVTPGLTEVLFIGGLLGTSGVWTNDADFTQVKNDNTHVAAYRIQSDATGQIFTVTSSALENSIMSLAAIEGAGGLPVSGNGRTLLLRVGQ